MAKPLFLYTDPFVVKNTPSNYSQYCLDYLTDIERAEQEKIHGFFLRFALETEIVEATEGRVTVRPEENMGSFIWITNWMNFRSLVDRNQYGTLLSSLQADNQHPVNQIIDLHSRLGILFDHHLLNTLVHRTLTSVSLIPYQTETNSPPIDWETIHRETPFIWILIHLQAVLRTTIDPLK